MENVYVIFGPRGSWRADRVRCGGQELQGYALAPVPGLASSPFRTRRRKYGSSGQSGTEVRTKSLWGPPPSRYYRLLRRAERLLGTRRPLTVAILGCADGKFVLPAARRGHRVVAIDVDPVALYGGEKPGLNGPVWMPGLVWRLDREGLRQRVQVVNGDFARDAPVFRCQLVLTSGALQYSRNCTNPMSSMIRSVKRYVAPGGLLYVDYMLPYESKYQGRQNCPGREAWNEYFLESRWRFFYNRVLPPVIDRAHVEYPVDHLHQWGHLLTQRVS